MSTAWPASIPIVSSEWRLNENKASTESLFTRARQVVSLSGGTADRWEGVLTTPPLTAAQVRTMMAFLVAVGRFGQVTIGDPDYDGPSSGEGDGAVDGAGQSGTSLDCKSFSTSTTILLAGEYFQVGTELKMLTADATTDGAGLVTLEFAPALRSSPGDSDPVILDGPVALVHLLENPVKATDSLKMGIFNIPFAEVLA